MAIADDKLPAAPEPRSDASLEDWLATRKSMIGASESPSILGEGYADEGPYTIWAKKTGLMPDKPDNELLWYGRKMQPITLERFTIETGLPVRDLGEFTIQRHPTISWLGATLDGVTEERDGTLAVVEAKNIGQYGAKEWSAPEPPMRVQIQIQHQLAVTGYQVGYAVATVGGNRLKFRRIERHDRFISAMIERLEEFWALVLDGRPPELDYTEATRIALGSIYANDNGKTVMLPPEALVWDRQLQRVKRHIKVLEKFKTGFENAIKAAIGENSYGELPDGTGELYSWRSHEVSEHVVSAHSAKPLVRVKAKGQKKPRKSLPAPAVETPQLDGPDILALPEPATPKRKKMTVPEIRLRLLAEHPHCRWCGKTLTKRTATLEHVIPKAHGGQTKVNGKVKWEHIALACKPCNQKRGDTGLDPKYLDDLED